MGLFTSKQATLCFQGPNYEFTLDIPPATTDETFQDKDIDKIQENAIDMIRIRTGDERMSKYDVAFSVMEHDYTIGLNALLKLDKFNQACYTIRVFHKIKINVLMNNNEKKTIQLFPVQSIQDVLVIVAKCLKTVPSAIQLNYNNETMEDKKTLQNYDIKDNADLICSIVHVYESSFQISYRNLIGRTKTLDVNRYHRVSDVKMMIEIVEGIPYSTQRLIFAGRQLEDQRTLSDNNITKESILNLVLRLRGT